MSRLYKNKKGEERNESKIPFKSIGYDSCCNHDCWRTSNECFCSIYHSFADMKDEYEF